MSLCRPLSALRYLVGRRAFAGASRTVLKPYPTFGPYTVPSRVRTFSISGQRCADDANTSSSESESDSGSESESESATRHGGVLGSNSEVEEPRVTVMKACLRFVRELGWNEAALKEGATTAGFEGEEKTLFSAGPGELVNVFEQHCNDRLYLFMEKLKEQSLVDSAVIRPSVEHRLRMLSPYIEKWPQAMALKAFPGVLPSSLETLSLMVDDMWYCAGDRSTDIGWYSRRAVLAAVYTSTELFMIQDTSEDFKDTWKFLDNRLRGVKDWEGVSRGLLEFLSAGMTNVRRLKDKWPTRIVKCSLCLLL